MLEVREGRPTGPVVQPAPVEAAQYAHRCGAQQRLINGRCAVEDYASPPLFHAALPALRPRTEYFYRFGAEDPWRSFRAPPPVGSPVRRTSQMRRFFFGSTL